MESNICAPVSLNLLNSLRKRDKMLDNPRILSLFLLNSFDKFIKHEHSCTWGFGKCDAAFGYYVFFKMETLAR